VEKIQLTGGKRKLEKVETKEHQTEAELITDAALLAII
jgi:hypothetical protein